MRIVADENVDRIVIERLRSKGHDEVAIIQEQPAIPDIDVLALSLDQSSLLITEDKDFGDLVFHRKRSYAGVLLISLEGDSRSKRIDMVRDLVGKRGEELRTSFSVLTPHSVRIRSVQ